MSKLKKNYIIGAHLSISKGFAQAAFDAKNINATALQIFTKSNRVWKSKPITQDEIHNWTNACKEVGIPKKNICVHASYLINLASEKIDIVEKSIKALIDELHRANILNIPTVILHPGSRGTQSIKEGCKKISNGIIEALLSTKETVIALESMAGQGSSLGSNLEELSTIIKDIPKTLHQRIGICLDTCHLFAAGYDLATKSKYEQFWDLFDKIIGRSFLKIIHINDSKKEFLSCIDRHEEIEKGLIPKNVFIQIMNDKSLEAVPKILETPKKSLLDDAKNVKRLLSYI